jgi:hypothetical protein
MPHSNKTRAGEQHFNELYGQVIGLYGDPTNQDSTANGLTRAAAFLNITWSASDLDKDLFWSRVVVCLILNPFDTSYHRAKIALVLRPRTLWLYNKSGQISDFVGNAVNAGNIGTANADGAITSVNPPYNIGDMIRIGTLPSAVNFTNWGDDFTKIYSEFYDSQAASTRNPALTVSNITINASGWVPFISDFTASKIIFYDKNVDARTRIVGGGGGGASVTIPVCRGGATEVYKLKGSRIS